MDNITITGLKIFANHGVLDFEKEKGQEFIVDCVLYVSTRKAGFSDDLSETVHYGIVSEFIANEFTATRYDLIEAVAENLCEKLLIKFPALKGVKLTVHKPNAPIKVPFSDVSVTIERFRHTAFIAVGSNIGKLEKTIAEGKKLLFSDERIKLLKESKLITTKAYGFTEQPDFLNGVWKVDTTLTPEELLDKLHEVENEMGRVRSIHWGPRTLDLDIIFYDKQIIKTKDLIVPHKDMENRSFVLEPMCEIEPYFVHPRLGKTMIELNEALQEKLNQE